MNTRWATAAGLILYLGILIGVGVWSRRRSLEFRDWVTGGGSIPTWMLALSFIANFISSNSFVGHAAQSYKAGLGWCVVGGIYVAFCFLSWWVLAPRFAAFARSHGATTLPDFFQIRFASRGLAIAVNWIIVATTLLYILAILRGTALVLGSGLGVGYVTALFVLYGVTVVYCMLGGLWADVSTDVVQTFVLTAGAIALFAGAARAAPMPSAAPPPIDPAPWGLLLAMGLSGGVKLLIDPKQVLVFYGFRDGQAVRHIRWVGPILLLVVYTCLFPLGFMARHLVPAPHHIDELIPSLVFDYHILGSWFGALFSVALLAASMSSLDSAFLVVASCLEKHVVAPALGSEPNTARTRFLLFLAATATLALSIRPIAGVLPLTMFAGALIGATLLPSVLLGLTSLKVPRGAVALSMAAGLTAAVLGKFGPRAIVTFSPWVQDVLVGLAASTLVLLPWTLRGRRQRAPAPDS